MLKDIKAISIDVKRKVLGFKSIFNFVYCVGALTVNHHQNMSVGRWRGSL